MQTMENFYTVAKKVNIRGYQTAKNVYFDATKVYFDGKKVHISVEKVYNIYQKYAENSAKSSYEVNQCEPR